MNPEPLTLEHPLEISDARRASHALAVLRRAAEDEHERKTDAAANTEREYRKAYAKAFIAAVGTAAEREAIARAESADKAYERDLAAGMVKVWAARLRGLEGERSQLKSLIDWSARLRLDDRDALSQGER